MHEITSYLSVALLCSFHIKSLEIWASIKCANTYPEENHHLTRDPTAIQHSFAFLSEWGAAKAAELTPTQVHIIAMWHLSHSSSWSAWKDSAVMLHVSPNTTILMFFIKMKVRKLPGVSHVSLCGISHWMNVSIHNEFRLEFHYHAKVYRKCMLIFSLSGMWNMKS